MFPASSTPAASTSSSGTRSSSISSLPNLLTNQQRRQSPATARVSTTISDSDMNRSVHHSSSARSPATGTTGSMGPLSSRLSDQYQYSSIESQKSRARAYGLDGHTQPVQPSPHKLLAHAHRLKQSTTTTKHPQQQSLATNSNQSSLPTPSPISRTRWLNGNVGPIILPPTEFLEERPRYPGVWKEPQTTPISYTTGNQRVNVSTSGSVDDEHSMRLNSNGPHSSRPSPGRVAINSHIQRHTHRPSHYRPPLSSLDGSAREVNSSEFMNQRHELLRYLNSPACHLFDPIPSTGAGSGTVSGSHYSKRATQPSLVDGIKMPLLQQLTPTVLDSCLSKSGGLQSLLSHLRCLDGSNSRFHNVREFQEGLDAAISNQEEVLKFLQGSNLLPNPNLLQPYHIRTLLEQSHTGFSTLSYLETFQRDEEWFDTIDELSQELKQRFERDEIRRTILEYLQSHGQLFIDHERIISSITLAQLDELFSAGGHKLSMTLNLLRELDQAHKQFADMTNLVLGVQLARIQPKPSKAIATLRSHPTEAEEESLGDRVNPSTNLHRHHRLIPGPPLVSARYLVDQRMQQQQQQQRQLEQQSLATAGPNQHDHHPQPPPVESKAERVERAKRDAIARANAAVERTRPRPQPPLGQTTQTQTSADGGLQVDSSVDHSHPVSAPVVTGTTNTSVSSSRIRKPRPILSASIVYRLEIEPHERTSHLTSQQPTNSNLIEIGTPIQHERPTNAYRSILYYDDVEPTNKSITRAQVTPSRSQSITNESSSINPQPPKNSHASRKEQAKLAAIERATAAVERTKLTHKPINKPSQPIHHQTTATTNDSNTPKIIVTSDLPIVLDAGHSNRSSVEVKKSKKSGGISFADPVPSDSGGTSKPSDQINLNFLTSLKNKRATVVLDLPKEAIEVDELDHALVESHTTQLKDENQTIEQNETNDLDRDQVISTIPTTTNSSITIDPHMIHTVEQEEVIEPDSPASDLDVEIINSRTDRASAIPSIIAYLRTSELLVKKSIRTNIKQHHAISILHAAGIDGTKDGAHVALKYMDQLTSDKLKFDSIEELILAITRTHQSYQATCQTILQALQRSNCVITPVTPDGKVDLADVSRLLDAINNSKYVSKLLNQLNREAILNHANATNGSSSTVTFKSMIQLAHSSRPYATWSDLITATQVCLTRLLEVTVPRQLDFLRVYLSASPAITTLFWESITDELIHSATSVVDPLLGLLDLVDGHLPRLMTILFKLESDARVFECFSDLTSAIQNELGDTIQWTQESVKFIESSFPSNEHHGSSPSIDSLEQMCVELIESPANLFIDIPSTYDHPLTYLHYLQLTGFGYHSFDQLLTGVEFVRSRMLNEEFFPEKLLIANYLQATHSKKSSLADHLTHPRSIECLLSSHDLDSLLAECSSFGGRAGSYAFWFLLNLNGSSPSVKPSTPLESIIHQARLSEMEAQRTLCEYIAFVTTNHAAASQSQSTTTGSTIPSSTTITTSSSLTLNQVIDLCWLPSIGPISARLMHSHVHRLHLSGYIISSDSHHLRDVLSAAHIEWLDARRGQKKLLTSFLTSNTCTLIQRPLLLQEGELEDLLRFNDAHIDSDSPVIPPALILFAHLLQLNHQHQTFINYNQLHAAVVQAHEDLDGLYSMLLTEINRRRSSFGSDLESSYRRSEVEPFIELFAQVAHADIPSTIIYAIYLIMLLQSNERFDSILEFFDHQSIHVRTLTQPYSTASHISRSTSSKIVAQTVYGVEKMMLRYFIATSSQVGPSLFYNPSVVRSVSESDLQQLLSASSTSRTDGSIQIVFELLLSLQLESECFEEWHELVARISALLEELTAEKKQCLTFLNTHLSDFFPSVVDRPPKQMTLKKYHIERLFQVGQLGMDTYDQLQALLTAATETTRLTYAGIDQLILTIRNRQSIGLPFVGSSGAVSLPPKIGRRNSLNQLAEHHARQAELAEMKLKESNRHSFRVALQRATNLFSPDHLSTIQARSDEGMDELLQMGGGFEMSLLSLFWSVDEGRRFPTIKSFEEYLQLEYFVSFDRIKAIQEWLSTDECAIMQTDAPKPTLLDSRRIYLESLAGKSVLDYLKLYQQHLNSTQLPPSDDGSTEYHSFTSLDDLIQYLKRHHRLTMDGFISDIRTIRVHLDSPHCTILNKSILTNLTDTDIGRLLKLNDSSCARALDQLIMFESVGLKFSSLDQLAISMEQAQLIRPQTARPTISPEEEAILGGRPTGIQPTFQSAKPALLDFQTTDVQPSTIESPSTNPSFVSEHALLAVRLNSHRQSFKDHLVHSKVASTLQPQDWPSDYLDELVLMGGGYEMTELSIQLAADSGLIFITQTSFEDYLQAENFDSFDSISLTYEFLISSDCSLFSSDCELSLLSTRQLWLESGCGKSTLTHLKQVQQSLQHSSTPLFSSLNELITQLKIRRHISIQSRLAEKQMLRAHLSSTRSTLLPKSIQAHLSDAALLHLLSISNDSGSSTLSNLQTFENAGLTFQSLESLFEAVEEIQEKIQTVKEDVRLYLNSMYCIFWDADINHLATTTSTHSSPSTPLIPCGLPSLMRIVMTDVDSLFVESQCGTDAMTLLFNFAFHGLNFSPDASHSGGMDELIELARVCHINLLARNQRSRARLLEALSKPDRHLFSEPVVASGRDLDQLLLTGGGLSTIDRTIEILELFGTSGRSFKSFAELFEGVSYQVFYSHMILVGTNIDTTDARMKILDLLLEFESSGMFHDCTDGMVITISLVNQIWAQMIEPQPLLTNEIPNDIQYHEVIGPDGVVERKEIPLPFTPSIVTPDLLIQYLVEFKASHLTFTSFHELISALLSRMNHQRKVAYTQAINQNQPIDPTETKVKDRNSSIPIGDKEEQLNQLKRAASLLKSQSTNPTNNKKGVTSSSSLSSSKHHPLPTPIVGRMSTGRKPSIKTNPTKLKVTSNQVDTKLASNEPTTPISQLISLLGSPTSLLKSSHLLIDHGAVERLIYYSHLSPHDVLPVVQHLAKNKTNQFMTLEALISAVQYQYRQQTKRASATIKPQPITRTNDIHLSGRPATAAGNVRSLSSLSSMNASNEMDQPSKQSLELNHTLSQRLMSADSKFLPSSIATSLTPATIEWLVLQGGGLTSTNLILDSVESRGQSFLKSASFGLTLRRARIHSFKELAEMIAWFKEHQMTTPTILPIQLMQQLTRYECGMIYEESQAGSYALDYLKQFASDGRSFQDLNELIHSIHSQHQLSMRHLESDKSILLRHLNTSECRRLLAPEFNFTDADLVQLLHIGGDATNTIVYLQQLSKMDIDGSRVNNSPYTNPTDVSNSTGANQPFLIHELPQLLSMVEIIHREYARAKRDTYQFFVNSAATNNQSNQDSTTTPTINLNLNQLTSITNTNEQVVDSATPPLPILPTSITVTRSDVNTLFLEGGGGLLTLSHLRCFQEFGLCFSNLTALISGLKAAQAGHIARFRASRYLLRSWLTSPQCKLFRTPTIAQQVTDQEIDSILTFSGDATTALITLKSIQLTNSINNHSTGSPINQTETSGDVTPTSTLPTTKKSIKLKSVSELLTRLNAVGRESLLTLLLSLTQTSVADGPIRSTSTVQLCGQMSAAVNEPIWRRSVLDWLNQHATHILHSVTSSSTTSASTPTPDSSHPWTDSMLTSLLNSTTSGRSLLSYLRSLVLQSRQFSDLTSLSEAIERHHQINLKRIRNYLSLHPSLVACVDQLELGDTSSSVDTSIVGTNVATRAIPISLFLSWCGLGDELLTHLKRLVRKSVTLHDLSELFDQLDLPPPSVSIPAPRLVGIELNPGPRSETKGKQTKRAKQSSAIKCSYYDEDKAPDDVCGRISAHTCDLCDRSFCDRHQSHGCIVDDEKRDPPPAVSAAATSSTHRPRRSSALLSDRYIIMPISLLSTVLFFLIMVGVCGADDRFASTIDVLQFPSQPLPCQDVTLSFQINPGKENLENVLIQLYLMSSLYSDRVPINYGRRCNSENIVVFPLELAQYGGQYNVTVKYAGSLSYLPLDLPLSFDLTFEERDVSDSLQLKAPTIINAGVRLVPQLFLLFEQFPAPVGATVTFSIRETNVQCPSYVNFRFFSDGCPLIVPSQPGKYHIDVQFQVTDSNCTILTGQATQELTVVDLQEFADAIQLNSQLIADEQTRATMKEATLLNLILDLSQRVTVLEARRPNLMYLGLTNNQKLSYASYVNFTDDHTSNECFCYSESWSENFSSAVHGRGDRNGNGHGNGNVNGNSNGDSGGNNGLGNAWGLRSSSCSDCLGHFKNCFVNQTLTFDRILLQEPANLGAISYNSTTGIFSLTQTGQYRLDAFIHLVSPGDRSHVNSNIGWVQAGSSIPIGPNVLNPINEENKSIKLSGMAGDNSMISSFITVQADLENPYQVQLMIFHFNSPSIIITDASTVSILLLR